MVMGLKDLEGRCLKCKDPLLVDDIFGKKVRPFCPRCEKELNDKIGQSFGKKGKRLIFPNKPGG